MKPRNRLLGLFIALAVQNCGQASNTLPVPFCAPLTLDGSSKVDFSELSGRFIYFDFWASWCAPCIESIPFLNKLNGEFSPQDLSIVGIDEDKNSNDATEFLKKHPANFMLVTDKDDRCAKAVNIEVMPSSYIVTKTGEVVYVHHGFRPSDVKTIEDEIHQLVKGKKQ